MAADDRSFEIRRDEPFPHLSNAPIIEAVIEIRADAEASWNQEQVREKLESQLKDTYPYLDEVIGFQGEMTFTPGTVLSSKSESTGWQGYRFYTEDKLQQARFLRGMFLYSRLKPYPHWEEFQTEALRLWQIHRSLSQASVITRMGVRFINIISDWASGSGVVSPLDPAPIQPRGLNLPHAGYLYQDGYSVPNRPYAANVLRSFPVKREPNATEGSVVVDIDAFTTQPLDANTDVLATSLQDLRWLKDKLFFGLVSGASLEQFK
jgi:uncharacterized protein (TIGR04255 family)